MKYFLFSLIFLSSFTIPFAQSNDPLARQLEQKYINFYNDALYGKVNEKSVNPLPKAPPSEVLSQLFSKYADTINEIYNIDENKKKPEKNYLEEIKSFRREIKRKPKWQSVKANLVSKNLSVFQKYGNILSLLPKEVKVYNLKVNTKKKSFIFLKEIVHIHYKNQWFSLPAPEKLARDIYYRESLKKGREFRDSIAKTPGEWSAELIKELQNAYGCANSFIEDFPPNYDQAYKLLENGINQRHPFALYQSGILLWKFTNSPESHKLGLQLLGEAAKNGYAPAQVEVGRLYLYGSKVVMPDSERKEIKPNIQLALTLLLNAVQQKSDEAHIALADFYMKNCAIKGSLTEALKWYQWGVANHKCAESAIMLGDFYLAGIGLNINYSKAKEYYNYAAKYGNLKSTIKATDRINNLNKWFSKLRNKTYPKSFRDTINSIEPVKK